VVLFLICFSASAQINFPWQPKDLNSVVKDYVLKTKINGLKEVSINQSIKRDGEALQNKPEQYKILYLENGQVKRYTKSYASEIFHKIEYLHLNGKLYREIEKIGSGYMVLQFYYAGDKVNHKQFVSRTESEDLVEILASQDDRPIENYTLENIRGEKIHRTLRIDHNRKINFTESESIFHSSGDTLPHTIKTRHDANTVYNVWKYTYTNDRKVQSATNFKSKIIAEVYKYSYYENGNLKKIARYENEKLLNELEFYYGKNGLLRTCLLASTQNKELLLTDFRYTFY
jgi:antitoxin component YwqK of YwqJK toxin-antitoxin module